MPADPTLLKSTVAERIALCHRSPSLMRFTARGIQKVMRVFASIKALRGAQQEDTEESGRNSPSFQKLQVRPSPPPAPGGPPHPPCSYAVKHAPHAPPPDLAQELPCCSAH